MEYVEQEITAYNKPESHYEILVSKAVNPVKEKAINCLSELHGWCTQKKASVLMDLIYMLQPKTVVEIGVFGGSSLVPMAFALKELGCGTIHGVDPWCSDASAEGMEGVNHDWWASLDHDAILHSLLNKLDEYQLNSCVHLIREKSEKAPLISNIDMIHIDGNHSEATSLSDVQKWVPLVRKGGIIIFDDMTWGTTYRAVEWLDKNCDRLVVFYESSVWGVWVKP